MAIADHRSSQPTAEEFRRLAAEVHLGGTISGKGGVLFIHVGDGESGLDLVESAMYGSDLPRRLFYPTHCNRRGELLEQAIAHANKGGYIDFTVSTTPELIEAGEVPALDGLRQAIDAGVPAGNLTFSSDAGGSLPHYRNGELVGLKAATPGSLLELLRTAADGQAAPPTEVLAALTCNPADALNLPLKGRIQPGADADLLLLDPAGAQLNDVFCLGRRLLRNGHIQIHTSRHTQD